MVYYLLVSCILNPKVVWASVWGSVSHGDCTFPSLPGQTNDQRYAGFSIAGYVVHRCQGLNSGPMDGCHRHVGCTNRKAWTTHKKGTLIPQSFTIGVDLGLVLEITILHSAYRSHYSQTLLHHTAFKWGFHITPYAHISNYEKELKMNNHILFRQFTVYPFQIHLSTHSVFPLSLLLHFLLCQSGKITM